MILITGATGTNGTALIEALHERSAQRFRALARDPERAANVLPGEVEFVRGDLNDPSSLDAAMEGTEKLFLLCPVDPRQVELETNVIDAARRAGVGHIVKFSVLHASIESPSAVLRWHGHAEQHIRESGIPFTFLRPNMFMQELLRQADSIRAKGEFYLPLGDAPVSLVDVRDNAAAGACALSEPGHEGQIYDLTGSEAITFHDAARELSAATGRTIRYVPVPMDAWKQGFLASGAPQWLVDAVAELYSTFVPANAMAGDGVERTTGTPPRTFDEFARDFAPALM